MEISEVGILTLYSILGLLPRSDLTHLPSPIFRRCSVSPSLPPFA